MRVSLNWLKDYVDIDKPPGELAGLLTMAGLEVEAVEFFEAVQEAADAGADSVRVTYRSADLELALPPLGEGDRGMVYTLKSHSLPLSDAPNALCVKVAKPQPVCRERLLEEMKTTEFYQSEQVAVPRIHYMEPSGAFCIKDFIEGESVTRLYMRFNSLIFTTG